VKLLAVVCFCAGISGFAAESGTIVGTVQARGRSAASDAAGGKYDSRKFKFAERVNYEELRGSVVFVEGTVEGTAAPALPVQVVTRKSVTQKGAAFLPHVLPVVVGTTVEWPNEDEIFHNVFSISEAKEFDLGLYKKPEVHRVTFDRPGRVDVFCSIHAAMNCVVLVLENSFFALADERLPGKRKEVTVTAAGEVRVDFTLGPGGDP
jgi:plastocyanin